MIRCVPWGITLLEEIEKPGFDRGRVKRGGRSIQLSAGRQTTSGGGFGVRNLRRFPHVVRLQNKVACAGRVQRHGPGSDRRVRFSSPGRSRSVAEKNLEQVFSIRTKRLNGGGDVGAG